MEPRTYKVTKIELDIQNSLSGTLKKGDSITLYQSGGYVPLTDHIAYYKDAFRYKEWSKEKINDTILQETINGRRTCSRYRSNILLNQI